MSKTKKKIHSGASKRFKLLKSGKIKHTKAFRRHLLTKKTTKQKRNLRSAGYIATADKRHLKSLLS
jgi:large subunit ribosomal protein L35